MFNLNESNHFLISSTPTDMRVGVNTMCGKVRHAGRIPTDGSVYVFVGKTRKVMKLLHWEPGGYAMYYKRLEQGRLSPHLFPSGSQVAFAKSGGTNWSCTSREYPPRPSAGLDPSASRPRGRRQEKVLAILG